MLKIDSLTKNHIQQICPLISKVRPEDMALAARHVVFEPNANVSFEDLKQGISHLKELWR